MNIDGLARKAAIEMKPKQISRVAIKIARVTPHQATTKPVRLFSFFDRKQATTIVVTFLITFIFSIATSQGLASIATNARQNFITEDKPLPAVEIAVTGQPSLATFNNTVQTQPGDVYLPMENINLPDPLEKRKEFLEKYLSAKHSPLANHVDAISEQSQWKLIIAISRAESSFCKHQVTNNCWGIGGAWNMKNYKNFDVAVSDVNRILERYYIQAGLTTPKKIVKKYVGHQSDNWQAAVEQELENLKDVE